MSRRTGSDSGVRARNSGHGSRALAGHRPVGAEGLAVEEHAAGEPHATDRASGRTRCRSAADRRRCRAAAACPRRERRGRVDRLGAAVSDHQPTVVGELVALGVTAEVVVVVEDQDPRGRAGRLTVEERRRQAAQPGADDDQVVDLAGIGGAGDLPGAAVARQRVRGLERPDVAAAQAGERGRIVGVRRHRTGLRRRGGIQRRPRQRGAGEGDTDAAQEVAPGHRTAHAEFAIGELCHVGLWSSLTDGYSVSAAGLSKMTQNLRTRSLCHL